MSIAQVHVVKLTGADGAEAKAFPVVAESWLEIRVNKHHLVRIVYASTASVLGCAVHLHFTILREDRSEHERGSSGGLILSSADPVTET